MEETNLTVQEEEKEPIYFAPKRVTLASDFASILSWFVLAGFIGNIVTQMISLRTQLATQNLAMATLLREPSFYGYLFINLVVPLLTGLGLFALLQAAAVGLNVLLEMDYNAREIKSK